MSLTYNSTMKLWSRQFLREKLLNAFIENFDVFQINLSVAWRVDSRGVVDVNS